MSIPFYARSRTAIARQVLSRAPSWNAHWRTQRWLTTASASPSPSKRLLRPLVLASLALSGVGAVSYGLWMVYVTMTVWPPELRGDLRAGLKARNAKDLDHSEQYITRALEAALTLPPSSLEPDYHLKLTGIAILLAGVLEDAHKTRAAYDVLAVALERLGRADEILVLDSDGNGDDAHPRHTPRLTARDRLRGTAMALKLAEMAERHGFGRREGAEERWLVWAVEQVLRVVRDAAPPAPAVPHPHSSHASATLSTPDSAVGEPESVAVVLVDIPLPDWVRMVDIGAPIEALGAYYAKAGKHEYATALYLQAISLLLPPNSSSLASVSLENKCRAAQLMSNLASVIVQSPPSITPAHAPSSSPDLELGGRSPWANDNIAQAEAWARKAYDVLRAAGVGTGTYDREDAQRRMRSTAENPDNVCDAALGAVFFNLGMLREMSNDAPSALAYYARALKHYASLTSNVPGKREGMAKARDGVRRLRRVREEVS